MTGEEDFEAPEKARGGLVPVLVARTRREAQHYVDILRDHDIPATVGSSEGDEDDGGPADGVPVMVPEETLDEASEVVADRENLEEFETEVEEAEDEDEDDLGFVKEIDSELDEDEELLYDEDDDDEEDEDDGDDEDF